MFLVSREREFGKGLVRRQLAAVVGDRVPGSGRLPGEVGSL